MIKVDIVSIPVKDQDRALAFYTEKLGFNVETDATCSETGMRWIELSIPEGNIRIALFTPQGQEDRVGSFSNVIFSCIDVQNTYETLKKKGVDFQQPPKQESWGTSSLFKDSEGNIFCLSQKS